MFILSRALKAIAREIKLYLVIELQLIVAFSVLIVSINGAMSANERVKVVRENLGITTYYVSSNNFYEETIEDRYQTAMEIKAYFQDKDIKLMYIFYRPITFYSETNGFLNANLVTLSENWYIEIFPEQKNITPVIAKTSANVSDYVNLERRINVLSKDEFTIDNIRMTYNEVDGRNGAVIINDGGAIITDIILENSIIVPDIDKYEELANLSIAQSTACIVRLDYPEDLYKVEIAKANIDLLNYLKTTFGKEYDIISALASVEKNIDDLSSTASLFLCFSVLSIVLATLGLMGVLIILLDRRKSNIYIKYLFGASLLQIRLELFCEILCLTFSGMIFALAISHYCSTWLVNDLYIYRIHVFSVIASSLCSLIISLYATGFTIAHVGHKVIIQEVG